MDLLLCTLSLVFRIFDFLYATGHLLSLGFTWCRIHWSYEINDKAEFALELQKALLREGLLPCSVPSSIFEVFQVSM